MFVQRLGIILGNHSSFSLQDLPILFLAKSSFETSAKSSSFICPILPKCGFLVETKRRPRRSPYKVKVSRISPPVSRNPWMITCTLVCSSPILVKFSLNLEERITLIIPGKYIHSSSISHQTNQLMDSGNS